MNNIDYRYKSKSNVSFACNFCKKTYKNKLNYDKHILLCELLHDKEDSYSILKHLIENSNSNTERKSSPNINNCIVDLMNTLIKKYDKLSYEMIEIKKWIKKEKKQINILDWLNNSNNNNTPDISFDDYINNFTFSELYIKKIIHNNIQDVYLNYIEDIFTNNSEEISDYINEYESKKNITIPICCFNEKPNKIYIYTYMELSKTILSTMCCR